MARAATTSDAFNAIAEPQRREILVLLRGGERPVTRLAQDMGMSQPQASKHLRVLREVGLVRVRDTYGVEIQPGQDDALILACTVCLDQMGRIG